MPSGARNIPPPEVKASFDLDYPTMGRVPDVLAASARCGFSLVGYFTLPDDAWRDDFCESSPDQTAREVLTTSRVVGADAH